MPDKLKTAAAVLAFLSLGACDTDPFGLKPEVNVTLPKTPPPDAAPADQTGDATPAEEKEGSTP